MVRDTLDGLPKALLPAGYALRSYRAGDRGAWLRIHTLAEHDRPVDADIYEQQFDADDSVRGGRPFFLLDDAGLEIGTASAWYGDEARGKDWGRVHWVAIVPQHQGKGLAKPLLSFVCEKLIEHGHHNAYLGTWDVKIPAINLYLLYGFMPEILNSQDQAVWDDLRSKCKY